jgi:hypothetical protein
MREFSGAVGGGTGCGGDPTEAQVAAADICARLVKRFRSSHAPMPLLVLRTRDSVPGMNDRVTRIVESLHESYTQGRYLCQRLPDPHVRSHRLGAPYCRAL